MVRFHYRTKKLIGGEFEINTIPNNPDHGLNKLTKGKSGTWTANGRSALYLILWQLKLQGVNHIHLPSFMCQEILQPVLSLGLGYSFYPVQPGLTAQPDPTKNSAVMLIHNFGFINNAFDALRKNTIQDYQLIEDASHVFLNDKYLNDFENEFVFFLQENTDLQYWRNSAT